MGSKTDSAEVEYVHGRAKIDDFKKNGVKYYKNNTCKTSFNRNHSNWPWITKTNLSNNILVNKSQAVHIDDFKNQEESTEDIPKHEDANRTFVNSKTTDETLKRTKSNVPIDVPPTVTNKEELKSTSSWRKRFKPKILDL